MVRNGLYATYKGRQFKAAKTSGEKIKLLADSSPPAGFQKTAYGNYTKTISPKEIEALSIIKTFIDVDGASFEVESEQNGYYVIGVPAGHKAPPGFEAAGKGDYRGKIPATGNYRIYEKSREASL